MEIEKLKDDLKSLSKRVEDLKASITNEEQTKNAFIMPFLQALGYDVFNPLEVIPEFTADVGIKKGERVDYAVSLDGVPQILVECKSITEPLQKHDSQLFRYFGTTSAKFGILTNGKDYRFYTDLEESNKMDTTPFLRFDVTQIKESQISEIARFHKDNFDIDTITSSASELKYLNAFKDFLNVNLKKPSDVFVEFSAKQIYDGKLTSKVKETFVPIISKAFSQFISEKVNEKLNAALKNSTSDSKSEISSEDETKNEIKKKVVDIVTTPEELEAYTVVKMILQDSIDPSRIFYRDNHSYFNVLIDNNIKKWILRYITKPNKISIEIRDKGTFEINTPLDIVKYSSELHEEITKFI